MALAPEMVEAHFYLASAHQAMYRPGKPSPENDAVRFWNTDDETGRDVAILSFKSKMCAIGPDVVEGIVEAVARAESDYEGLVIWQPRPPFSAGANLAMLAPLLEAGDFAGLEKAVAGYQKFARAQRQPAG